MPRRASPRRARHVRTLFFMSLHIIKLCVGADSIDDLSHWQTARLEKSGRLFHTTRMTPRRRAEVLDGGSLYWVIKGMVAVRQRLVDLAEFTDGEGIGRCDLVLDPVLVPVEPAPKRPFQGWRYLKPEDAPPDLRAGAGGADLPPELRAALRELGAW